MTIQFDPGAGSHIRDACIEALRIANQEKQEVEFTFNGVKVIGHPGDSAESIQSKWSADTEASRKAYYESPEYKARQEKEAEEYARKSSAVMIETAKTEEEMRNAPEPWPYTEKQLLEYIHSLVDRSHDYGTCCYALSLAASAAFRFVSHKLGVSGFQASCGDLDFLRRTRSMKGPFIILKAEDLLFPQYDLPARLNEAISEWQPWVKEQAQKYIAEKESMVHPKVLTHWKELAGMQITK